MFDKIFFFTPLFSTCFCIRDPGWVKIRIRDPGSGINIPDPQHCFFEPGRVRDPLLLLTDPCPRIRNPKLRIQILPEHFYAPPPPKKKVVK
jgi:hypothetical protein